MELPKRKHPRLKNFDYSSCGTYFLTICAKNKECIFSRIIVGRDDPGAPETSLTGIGRTIEKYILKIPEVYKGTTIENYVIMPNHVHILLTMSDILSTNLADCGAPRLSRPTVSTIVGALKCFTNRETGKKLWQTGFYDHIVRDEEDFLIRWQYISRNPAKWYFNLN